ncbi:MAG: glycerate kinase [Candidatus Didemnitutus sp.]|nr:glycerate kinase [Candidatus Didemnitutus sp.]
MRFLLAFDKFKDALSAPEACAVAAQALGPGHATELCPLTDGGEGFCSILTRAVGGELVSCPVTGPLGTPVSAHYGLVDVAQLPPAVRTLLGLAAGARRLAIVEMAQASGLALVPADRRDPWQTTSRGTGELIAAAADAGADAILVGVGGSATHDAGLGALTALGFECRTADGARLDPPVPQTWAALAVVAGQLRPLPPLFVACDVTNPLMGTFGAAAVYAPQKGLQPEDFTRLEYMTGRMAALLCTHAKKHPLLCETPGAGAAGGLAFGLLAAADATLVPGFALVAEWLDLDAKLAACDVVLTGEGRFDASSLQGKGPGAVVRRALDRGKPVHVFAGSVDLPEPVAAVRTHALSPAGLPLEAALAATREHLAAAVRAEFGS